MRRRKRMLEDLDHDICDHIARETQDNIERGMSPEEARYMAMRKFGNVTRVKEETREVWSFVWLEQLLQDIHFGLRMLRKSPGFAATAILTLALGIGANSAIFSVVQRVLLRPLPYPHAENLVKISNSYKPVWPQLALSPGDYADWRQQARSFSDMGAYVAISAGFNMTGDGATERIQAAYSTAELFLLLGVRAGVGRTFSPEENKTGSAPVALLSHRFWLSHFGGDAGAVGKTITLDGQRFTLVGVLPGDFQLETWPDIWLPSGQYPDDLTGRVHHPFT